MGSGMVRGMLVFAINEKNETVRDGTLDVPPENAQHFSVSLGNCRFAVGSSRAPTPTVGGSSALYFL